eukprot:3912754-Rhodomonas_salina.1
MPCAVYRTTPVQRPTRSCCTEAHIVRRQVELRLPEHLLGILQVPPAIALRARYAAPSTDFPYAAVPPTAQGSTGSGRYGATDCAVLKSGMTLRECVVLRPAAYYGDAARTRGPCPSP